MRSLDVIATLSALGVGQLGHLGLLDLGNHTLVFRHVFVDELDDELEPDGDDNRADASGDGGNPGGGSVGDHATRQRDRDILWRQQLARVAFPGSLVGGHLVLAAVSSRRARRQVGQRPGVGLVLHPPVDTLLNHKVCDDPGGDEGEEREEDERHLERVAGVEHDDLGEQEQQPGDQRGNRRRDDPRENNGHDAPRERIISPLGRTVPDDRVGTGRNHRRADNRPDHRVGGRHGKLEEGGEGEPEPGGQHRTQHHVHQQLGRVGVGIDFGNALADRARYARSEQHGSRKLEDGRHDNGLS